jgi:outer membrane protein assembly factor BamB
MAYYPKWKLLLVITRVPDNVIINTRKLWHTEVVAYSLDRKVAWRRRLPSPDASALRFDGEVAIVTNTPPYYPHERTPEQGAVFVKRIDPASGNDLWSTTPVIGAASSGAPGEAVSIPYKGYVFLYNVATGLQTWQWQIPAGMKGLPVALPGDAKRLYVARDAPQPGGPPGAIERGTGKLLWSDESVEAYHTRPVVWGDKVVYRVWPPNAPTTGLLAIARLYIHSPNGTYLLTEKEMDVRSNDPSQIHDGLLYTINGYNIVAYRWLDR